MSEAYETRMDSIALKIRWISVQCYEMVLPGGKTLVTDPFYWDMSHFDGLTEDDQEPEAGKKSVRAERIFRGSVYRCGLYPAEPCPWRSLQFDRRIVESFLWKSAGSSGVCGRNSKSF